MSTPLPSLPPGFRAIVVGASGAIGGAFTEALRSDRHCAHVLALSRQSTPGVDFNDMDSVARAAETARQHGPCHLLVVATGMLHGASGLPEKRLTQLDPAHMQASFNVNAIGPAMVLAHFTPLLARQERSLVAVLSAKVGSISDNRLGGWYSYRAAKAALNMLVKTAAIELGRSHPQAVLAALHPGTVASPLSEPFGDARTKRAPTQAVATLLHVLDGLRPEHSGQLWSHDGQPLPW